MDSIENSTDKRDLYQERLERIKKAVRLEPVDQVPNIFIGVGFAPRYMGMPLSKFCTDEEAAVSVTLDAMDRLGDIDGINGAVVGRIHLGLSTLWLSHVNIPGRELPEDVLWQVEEKEVMTVDDYDFIIENGWDAFFMQYLPKVVDMQEFGQMVAWVEANTPQAYDRFRDRGYALVSGGITTIPFEYFCGGRSMTQFFLDLYRIPDKVKAAMDVVLPSAIEQGIGGAKASGALGVWVGGWRAASALVAPKLWDEFVFPYYLEIANALVENDIVPIFHWDQDWTRDLERLLEMPAKKCILNPDGMTDIRKAKEILGDHMAIMGDVPASMFAAGTPEDVYDYVRDLVRDVGPEGLLLCPGCDAPVNTKPENMEAFLAAGRQYGSVH